MKVSLRNWVVLGLVIFTWSVIANAPASIVGKVLQDSGIRGQSYSGTLWKGRASSLGLYVSEEPIYLEQLDWDLKLLSLLMFSPTADISATGPGLSIKGEASLLGGGHWRMKEGDISFPAALLGKTTLGNFAGNIVLQVAEIEIENGTVKAFGGRAIWQSARWLFDNRWWTLGNFAADLSSEQGNILATVFDQGGSIGLKGRVVVDLSGSYNFSGDVKPREDAPKELRPALSVIGESGSDGNYRVNFQGNFPVN